MSDYGLIIFASTHDAIRAHKLLREERPVQLIPTPRRFSTSCGISLRFAAADQPLIEELMQRHQLQGELHRQDH